MASSLRSAHNNFNVLDTSETDWARALGSLEWLRVGTSGCFQKNGKIPALERMLSKCLISMAMFFLLLQSAIATEDEGNYETSGFSALQQDSVASTGPAHPFSRWLMAEEEPFPRLQTDPPGAAESTRLQPAFSSILTLLASSAKRPQTLVQSIASPVISSNDTQLHLWLSDDASRGTEPLSSASAVTSNFSSYSGLTPSMHHHASSLPQSESPSSSPSSSPMSLLSSSIYLLLTLMPTHNHPSSSSSISLTKQSTATVDTVTPTSGFTSNGNEIHMKATLRPRSNTSKSFSFTTMAESEARKTADTPLQISLGPDESTKMSSVNKELYLAANTTIHLPFYFVTASKTSSTKHTSAVSRKVKRNVSSDDQLTRPLFSALFSPVNSETLVKKEGTSPQATGLTPMAPMTTAQSSMGSIVLPFSSPHTHFGSRHVAGKTTVFSFLRKGTSAKPDVEEPLLESALHSTEPAVPSNTNVSSRTPAITPRISFVSSPAFVDTTSTEVSAMFSVQHMLSSPTNPQESLTPDLPMKSVYKVTSLGHPGSDVSVLYIYSNENSAVDTGLTLTPPIPQNEKASALAYFGSPPDSETVSDPQIKPSTTPLKSSLTLEPEPTSKLLPDPSGTPKQVIARSQTSSHGSPPESNTTYAIRDITVLQTAGAREGAVSGEKSDNLSSITTLGGFVSVPHEAASLSTSPLATSLFQFPAQSPLASNSPEAVTPEMPESSDVFLSFIPKVSSVSKAVSDQFYTLDFLNSKPVEYLESTSVESSQTFHVSESTRPKRELLSSVFRTNDFTSGRSAEYTSGEHHVTIDGDSAQTRTQPNTVGSVSDSYTEATKGLNMLTSTGSTSEIWLSQNTKDEMHSVALEHTTPDYALLTFGDNLLLSSKVSPSHTIPTEVTSDSASVIAASTITLQSGSDTGTELTPAETEMFLEEYKNVTNGSSEYSITYLSDIDDIERQSSTFVGTSSATDDQKSQTFPNDIYSVSSAWNRYSSPAKETSSISSEGEKTTVADVVNYGTSTAEVTLAEATLSTLQRSSLSSLATSPPSLMPPSSTLTSLSATGEEESQTVTENSVYHYTSLAHESSSVSMDTLSNIYASYTSVNTDLGLPSPETTLSSGSLTTDMSLPVASSSFSLSTYQSHTPESRSSPIMSSLMLSRSLVPFIKTSSYPKPSGGTTSPSSMPSDVTSSISVIHSVVVSGNATHSLTTEDPQWDDLSTSSLSTSAETENSPTENATTSPPAHMNYTATPDNSEATSTRVASTTLAQKANDGLQPTTVTTTMTSTTRSMSTILPTTTAQPTEMTASKKTTTASPRTSTTGSTSVSFTTTKTPKTTAPGEATTRLRTTSTTDLPPMKCNITDAIRVKTVLSVHLRRNRLDNALKQNLPKGLTQALQKAFNNSHVHAQIENLTSTPNVTVGYYVASGRTVYMASTVVEVLSEYGMDMLLADIRQYVHLVQSLPVPIAPMRPSPAISLQLKTVLRFVGPGDNIKSCGFAQMMERRLENAFAEAESKVLNSHHGLTVQVLGSYRASGSPAVTLIYVVRNGSTVLNGTVSSNLLNQLSAELVGYFLLFPPLIIAEPLEYHNLNTSAATRDYWVITVIQDVDNASLEGNSQSFASLMEQRLAEVFVVVTQQGTRFRRATTVGTYTVQMVSIRRVPGPKNPAEMTYYVQLNGIPLLGTSAAKILNTVDSQTMALALGYFVQLQAEPVVKNPPNNLWIIAAVLAPIAVVTVIIIIITAVLCRKNKADFKTDGMGNLNPRAKTAYRREASYYHQPVQGFDYAKQHLGQQGGEEDALPVTQETMVLPLPIRDAPLSQERGMYQDGSTSRKTHSSEIRKSRLPSEDGSVASNESAKLNSGRGLSAQRKVTTQQKMTKEETRKRNGMKLRNRIDPYDTSSGSLQLISIKPMAAQPAYSHPASSDRSQDSAILNGEVSTALKQKSDIEHYRNKLRLKAKRKGYYDFPAIEASHRQRHGHEKRSLELSRGPGPDPDEERASTFVKSRRRHSQLRSSAYRSRQSLNSPSPGGTEMDLLVMRERPRRGIRNSGYDTEPELIEETNVDRMMGPRVFSGGRQVKGHSDTSTLSSQPSIDEVRQQMHLLLEEAFSLASAGHSTGGRHHHHLHHSPYSPGQPMPYSEVVTSAPGTMSRTHGGLQWVPAYRSDMYQCSLPKPAFRFTQLPDMAMGSSPPPIPPRTGPTPGTSLRRSSSDISQKARTSESSAPETQSQHDSAPYLPLTRTALPSLTTDQSLSNYSGNPISAVYAIPASRPGYSGYFVSTPPTSYRSPSWMSYPPEPDDVPPQWADSVPLPGYVEAFPHPRYPQGSPMLPRQYSQASSTRSAPDNPPTPSTAVSQQSLTGTVETPDTSLSNLSTAALVKAIREEVAKLAKKQTDMFEFQV